MDDDLPELRHGIPVFPLPGITLFPHTLLPLHIFEDRYRALIEDTLRRPEDQHCFAMGTLMDAASGETLGDPPVFRYAGVGRISEFSRMPDGRFALVLRGIGRVRLSHEHSLIRGYRVFGAEWLPDIRPQPGGSWERNLGVELKALALSLLREQAEKFRGMLAEHVELGPLTDMICGYLPFPPEFKLQQMQSRNVFERAARTISQLEALGGYAPEKPLKLDDAPPVN
jgi:Lon protease-like protein